jgi:DNA-binding transcriptional MerR regulator
MVTETRYTVKQLARIAGVSARTLHYYDEIGLLNPDRNPNNGYRLYPYEALLRLQQILFLRELGLSLDEILVVLDQPGFNLLNALEMHRKALLARQERLAALVQTVDRTINHLKGSIPMDDKQLFEGFSEEQQAEYAKEAERRWGSQNVKESQKRWASYSPEKKKAVLEEGKAIYLDLIASMPLGPSSPQAQACVARWHQNLRNFYEPTKEILLGLGDLYNDDPDFNATFVRMHPDLAPFVREAIKHYCQKL